MLRDFSVPDPAAFPLPARAGRSRLPFIPVLAALVGVGAGGTAARAPFTFIISAFGLTENYAAVLPLMLVVVIAHGCGGCTRITGPKPAG